jgi:hypothetical protein
MKKKLIMLKLALALLLGGGIVFANQNSVRSSHSTIKKTKKISASSTNIPFFPFVGFE